MDVLTSGGGGFGGNAGLPTVDGLPGRSTAAAVIGFGSAGCFDSLDDDDVAAAAAAAAT